MSDKIKRSDLVTDDGKLTVIGAISLIFVLNKAIEIFCKGLKELDNEK